MKVIPVSIARKKLGDFMNEVKYTNSMIALGKHGMPEAMLIAFPSSYLDVSMTHVNAGSESFSFLDDEPDLYSLHDLKHAPQKR